MAEKQQTVTEMIQKAVEKMCDEYCKFPQMYTEENEDKLYEEHCDGCVLNKLI